MLTEMIVMEDCPRHRAGIKAGDAYRVWAKRGLNAIMGYVVDNGMCYNNRLLAFSIEGLDTRNLSIVRLLDDDLLLSGGDKLYIIEPICVVTQSRMPF